MKVELHILQNFPPSNLNRDEAGAPKDCDFGGVRRARISSQCLKRSIRKSGAFEKALNYQVGQRTKRTPWEIANRLVAQGRSADESRVLAEAFLIGVLKALADDGRTRYLYYIGPDELDYITTVLNEHFDALADRARAVAAARELLAEAEQGAEEAEGRVQESEAQLAQSIKKHADSFVDRYEHRTRTVDIALFGRMLADEPRLNVDGACQVAHAISTNRVLMEFDYYTAVDDLQPDDEPGAGMIGTIGYNASCYYRYALVDLAQLAKNLRESKDNSTITASDRALARDGVLAFLRGSVAAVPSGKMTSFAQQAPPALVIAVVREGSTPMSLVNAFERPARPHERDGREVSLVENSIDKLGKHWAALRKMYGSDGGKAYFVLLEGMGNPAALSEHGVEEVGSIEALVKSVGSDLDGWVKQGVQTEEGEE